MTTRAQALGCLCVLVALSAFAPSQKERPVATRFKGEFDVKLIPQPSDDPSTGRMIIEKEYHGDLVGTAKGQMLTGGGEVKDSGVYVAIEKVTGTVKGRTGTFILYHTGVMTRGAQSLTVMVAPDSGTGGFVGISGTMTITIENGKHSYELVVEGI
jgi:hypothetical protein